MPHSNAELASLRALFDSFPTGVLVADDNARYTAANEAACRLLGRTREQVIGSHLSDIVAPGRRVDVSAQWLAFLRDGVQSGSFDLLLPSGAVRRVDFHAQANFFPGMHCSFLSAATDHPTADNRKLLTMCAWTKRVKVGPHWQPIEQYLSERFGVRVSHGICPTASARYFGD